MNVLAELASARTLTGGNRRGSLLTRNDDRAPAPNSHGPQSHVVRSPEFSPTQNDARTA